MRYLNALNGGIGAAASEMKNIMVSMMEPRSPISGLYFCGGFIISPALIKYILGDAADYTYFVCGPLAMYDFVIPELHKLGVPQRKIRQEVQTPPANPSKLAGWPENITEEQDDYPICVRMSGDEMVTDGHKKRDAATMSMLLEEAGADLISVSCGVCGAGHGIAPAARETGHNVEFAEEIRRAVNIPVVVAGRITEPEYAEFLLRTDKVQLSVG